MYTLKKCWVVSTQFWVKYGQTQVLGKKCNYKNFQLKVKVEVGLKFEIQFLTQH